jgi:uncharacterized protein (UPF0332 family)
LTGARVEAVEPDPEVARRTLDQACSHLRSARVEGVDAESAYGLAYQAALKAMVAALLFDGQRVTSGTGGHVVILREAAKRLALDPKLVDRLDHMRRTRHRVFYDIAEISGLEIEGALADADTLLEAARHHVGRS